MKALYTKPTLVRLSVIQWWDDRAFTIIASQQCAGFGASIALSIGKLIAVDCSTTEDLPLPVAKTT